MAVNSFLVRIEVSTPQVVIHTLEMLGGLGVDHRGAQMGAKITENSIKLSSILTGVKKAKNA